MRPATSSPTPIPSIQPRRSPRGRRNRSTCAGEHPQQYRGDRGQRADDPFRIPGFRLVVVVAAQHDAVHVVSEVALDPEVAGAEARDRHQHHQRPVAGEQPHRPRQPPAQPRREPDRRARQVADRDALQHAQDAPGREIEARKAYRKRPNGEQDRGTAQRLLEQARARRTRGQALLEGQRQRHPDNPEEGREHDVSRRPPVPLGVLQWCVDVAAVAGRVDEHHQARSSPRGTRRVTRGAWRSQRPPSDCAQLCS